MNKHVLLIAVMACALGLSSCSHLPSWAGGRTEQKPKLPGERIAVLPVDATLKPDEALKNKAVALPPVAENSAWPQQTGSVPAAAGNMAVRGNLDTMVSNSAGNGEPFSHTLIPRPVVANNMVFSMDAAGIISAHQADNVRHSLWESKAIYVEDGPEVIGGGLAFDEGKLYATSGRGIVGAMDAGSGVAIWRKDLHLPLRSPPIVRGGKLFAITIDNQTYALNAATGDVLWNHRGIGETTGLMNSVSPALSGDTLIVPYSSGQIYALSVANGQELWSESLSPGTRTQATAFFSGIGGDPVIDSGVVFAVSNSGTLSVFALANGQRAWERAIGGINTPWVAGDYLFLLTSDNTLICMVKFNGRIQWSMRLQGYEDEERKKDPISWKGPILVGGNLAVISSTGQLLLISAADGKIVATKTVPEGIYTAPIVAGGRIYFVTQDATIYSLQ